MPSRRERVALGGLLALALATPSTAAPRLPVLDGGVTERVTLRLDGSQAVNPEHGPYSVYAAEPSISASGRYVVFTTGFDLGVARCADTEPFFDNGGNHVYLRDLLTGRLELVSATTRGCLGGGSSGDSFTSVSGDGRFVAFTSQSRRLVGGVAFPKEGVVPNQVYLRDRLKQRTRIVSLGVDGKPANWNSEYPSVSDDGRFVLFTSKATNLVKGDSADRPDQRLPDLFLRDMLTGRTERVGPKLPAGQGKWEATLSGNGRYVVFRGDGPNLAPHKGSGTIYSPGDQAYVWDRVTKNIELASRDEAGHAADSFPHLALRTSRAISRDGRWIVFDSAASNLIAGEPPVNQLLAHVYLHDRVTKRTIRVSAGPGGVPGNHHSEFACISPDGRWVSYRSYASNLGDVDLSPPLFPTPAESGADIYLYDRETGTNRLVSRSTDGVPADLDSLESCPSDGGKVVVFASKASTLVAGDTNTQPDIFVRRYP